jgi:surface protein
MDFKKITMRCLKKLIMAFLAFSMVLTTGMSDVFATNQVTPDYNEDIKLSMKWQMGKNDQRDHLDIHATTSSSQRFVQRISYSSDCVSQDYEAGQLSIVVKGMKKLYRDNSLKAEKVAADLSTESAKVRDWSYSYNNASDEYTFTNNRKIKKDSTLDGFFDIVYNVYPRQSKHGLNLEGNDALYSMLYYPDGSANKSNTITLTNTTEPSKYEVGITQGQTFSDSGLNGYIDDTKKSDYILLKYNLSVMVQNKARDLEVLQYTLKLPEGFKVCKNNINIKSTNKDNNYIVNVNQRSENYIYVACPKTYLGSSFNIKFDLNGLYYEDENIDLHNISTSSVTTELPSDYKYDTPQGPEYSFGVYTPKSKNLISSDIQSSRGQDTTYYVTTGYNRSSQQNVEMPTIIDHHFISKNSKEYRQMNDQEYDITSISTDRTYNDIGEQVSTGTYQIYACKSSVFNQANAIPIEEGNMSDLKNRNFPMPEGTKSVAIIYRGFHEIFTSCFKVNINIHDVSDDTQFDPGKVIHDASTRVLHYDADWNNFEDYTAQTTIDVPGVNVNELDKNDYGDIKLTRDADHENITNGYINNYMYTNALFSNLHRDSETSMSGKGKLQASFNFLDDKSKPSQFTLYTILPEGVHLKGVDSIKEIYDSISFTGKGTNVSDSYLSQHCTPTMIKNYRNSGRTYLAFKFDLNPGDMERNGNVSIDMDLLIDLESVDNNGYSGSLQSYLRYDDSKVSLDKFNLHKDDGTSYGGDIYKDINQDKSTDDMVATAEDTESYIPAASGQFDIKKYIKGSKDNAYTSDHTFTEIGKEYKYALEVNAGTGTLEDIVIHEDLEALGEAKGKFKSISFTKGFTGKYDQKKKTITIDQPVSEGKTLRVYITMLMPDDAEINKSIKNQFTLDATIKSNEGIDIKKEEGLPSNETKAVISTRKGAIAVKKVDEITKEPLSNATFGIYENESSTEPITTKTTNTNGYAYFKNLEYGQSYYIKEIKAPKGYQLTEGKMAKVNVNDDVVDFKVADKRILGQIKVTKRSNLDKKAKLPGAQFTLSKVNGDQKVVVGKETTGTDGTVTFDKLEWGKYLLEETRAPNGYSISTEPKEIIVSSNNVVDGQNKSTAINVDVENKQDDVLVTLNKFIKDIFGKETNERLQGAKFELYKVDDESSYDLSKSKLIGQYYTNQDGQIMIDQLAYGTYVFHELIFPRGYESGNTDDSIYRDDYVFKLTPDNKNVVLNAYNKRKAGSISIKKSDGKGHIVTGAKFTLYDADMKPIKEDVEVNENGVLSFENLEWGTYHVKETTAPLGYSLDPKTYDVTIKASQLHLRLEIANSEILGNIKLKKVDNDSNRPLQNAEFNLCKDDGSFVGTLKTDENGEALYEGLSWGTYYLEETKAPEGYTIDTTKHRFVVNAYTAGKTQTLEIKNKMSYNKSFKLTKRIKKDDIWKPHGQVVFNYNISYVDNTGKTIYRNASLNFSKYKTETIGGTQYAVVSTVIDKIPSSVTEVKVYEYGTNRYELVNVIDQNDKQLLSEKNEKNKYSSYTLSLDGDASIIFENDKVNWKDYSDSSSTINSISKKAWLTSITAVNNDKEVKPRSEVNMTVYANYTDGTHKELSSNEYKIIKSDGFTKKDGKLCWPNRPGSYVIEVEYQGYTDTITGTIDQKDVIDDPCLIHKVDRLFGYGDQKLGYISDLNHIVFTTRTAPEGVKVVKAEERDGQLYDGIVGWIYNKTLYLSTQDAAKRIKLQDDSSNEFSTVKSHLQRIDGMEFVDTSNVTNMQSMFKGCEFLKQLDLSEFDTSKVTDMSNMFYDCKNLEQLDLSKFDTSKVTDMSKMFYDCNSLKQLDLSKFDTSKVTDMSNMFSSCNHLEQLDLSKFDTSKVTNMKGMFEYCKYLRQLDLSKFDTSKVTNMSYMFYGCEFLKQLDLSKFDTSKVTNMQGMFASCYYLKQLDLSNLHTSNVTKMNDMFRSCGILSELDLSNFDTSKVTDMSNMFDNCSSLKQLDLSKFDTSKVTDMSNMFYDCYSLEQLDLSKFDTSKVTNMQGMFVSCYYLKQLDTSKFDTSKVTDMSIMFSSCNHLEQLDLSKFDTSKVTNMKGMFNSCTNLQDLDLSSWNTSLVKNMASMFKNSHIKTIYVSKKWNVSGVKTSSNMFDGCIYLVGQSGTTYDSSKVDKSMANYETGYLTNKNDPILLDYCYDDYSEMIPGGIDSSKLPQPERAGYAFVGWYHKATRTLINKMETFTNPEDKYSWTKNADGSWSSGNKGQHNTQSKMISKEFTLDKKGMISFEWRSNGESNYDYLGYDIYDVKNKKYLSGQGTPNYMNCLENLKGRPSDIYSKVTKELNPGTYQIVFMYGKDYSGNSYEDQGFVKNVYYGSEFHYEYEKPVIPNELLPYGINLYAKWEKKQ